MGIRTFFFTGAPATPAQLLDAAWQRTQPHYECLGVSDADLGAWQVLLEAAVPACRGSDDGFISATDPHDRADGTFSSRIWRLSPRLTRAFAGLEDTDLESLVQRWQTAATADHAREHRTGWLAQHPPCDEGCLQTHVGPVAWRRDLFAALRGMARGLVAPGPAPEAHHTRPGLYMYYTLQNR